VTIYLLVSSLKNFLLMFLGLFLSVFIIKNVMKIRKSSLWLFIIISTAICIVLGVTMVAKIINCGHSCDSFGCIGCIFILYATYFLINILLLILLIPIIAIDFINIEAKIQFSRFKKVLLVIKMVIFIFSLWLFLKSLPSSTFYFPILISTILHV